MKLAEEYQNLQEEIKKYEQEGNYQQLKKSSKKNNWSATLIFGPK